MFLSSLGCQQHKTLLLHLTRKKETGLYYQSLQI